MFILGLFRWWYGEGFQGQLHAIKRNIGSIADYFSVLLLLKTLFSPFRQISAGKGNGSLAMRWRAWLDRLVSRFVGAMLRSLTIIAGLVTLLLSFLLGMVRLVGWLLLPLLPAFGMTMMIVGLKVR